MSLDYTLYISNRYTIMYNIHFKYTHNDTHNDIQDTAPRSPINPDVIQNLPRLAPHPDNIYVAVRCQTKPEEAQTGQPTPALDARVQANAATCGLLASNHHMRRLPALRKIRRSIPRIE